ncbi:MAG: hypothetical protein KKA60_11020, partial [Proteobacteria bacterium]|nr:hypothetical protein [Pseudomonadota bacterium]
MEPRHSLFLPPAWPVFFAFALALVLARPCPAGTLSIHTRMTAVSGAGTLAVEVAVENRGTATAKNVEVVLEADDLRMFSRVAEELPPGGEAGATFRTDVEAKKPGRYPLALRVLYTDEDGYPFSAVHGATFSPIRDEAPGVEVLAPQAQLAGQGPYEIRIQGAAVGEVRTRARIFLPREIAAERTSLSMILAPGETVVRFDLKNQSAMPGASYPVYVFVEYDAEGVHHTAVGEGSLLVRPRAGWFRRTRGAWTLAAAACGAAFLFLLALAAV